VGAAIGYYKAQKIEEEHNVISGSPNMEFMDRGANPQEDVNASAEPFKKDTNWWAILLTIAACALLILAGMGTNSTGYIFLVLGGVATVVAVISMDFTAITLPTKVCGSSIELLNAGIGGDGFSERRDGNKKGNTKWVDKDGVIKDCPNSSEIIDYQIRLKKGTYNGNLTASKEKLLDECTIDYAKEVSERDAIAIQIIDPQTGNKKTEKYQHKDQWRQNEDYAKQPEAPWFDNPKASCFNFRRRLPTLERLLEEIHRD